MNTVILLRGLPGSGKTSVAKSICDLNPEQSAYFEADQYWETVYEGLSYNEAWNKAKDEGTLYSHLKNAHEQCAMKFVRAMEDQVPLIIVSNTFVKEWEMKNYIESAEYMDYRVVTMIVENRHNGDSLHNVPEDVMFKMYNSFNISLWNLGGFSRNTLNVPVVVDNMITTFNNNQENTDI